MAVELPSSEAEVEALLESAVSSRASHIKRESQSITMANVRRLLENDLGLKTSTLDPHKGFIRKLVDQVLLSSDYGEAEEGEEDEKVVSEEMPKKPSGSKRLKKSAGKKVKKENGSAEDLEDLQEEDVQEAPKKKQKKEKETKASSKEEDENGGGNNAEVSEEDLQVEAPKKKKKQSKGENKEESSHSKEMDEDVSRSHVEMSEEDSDVSEVKAAKKVFPKAASLKPVQNKKIEHVKKIIKACGLSIPPQIYKRMKQLSDEKQDKFLMEELEAILSRQGLSLNPSDKEIKRVKQKLAREKDMEGMDTTNIILEPRGRRATSQLFAPVYNPPLAEYDSDEDGEEEEEESEDGGEGSEEEGKESAGGEDSEGSD